MRLIHFWTLLFVVCITASAASAQDPHDAATAAKLSEFLRSNFSSNAKADLQQKTIAAATSFAAKGSNVQSLIGADLTLRRKALFILTFGDDLHVFELTPAQARGLGIRPDITATRGFTHIEAELRIEKPAFALTNLAFKNPDAVPGDREVTGSVTCKPTGAPVTGPLSLSVIVKRPNGMTRTYRQMRDAEANGVIQIHIDALNRGKEELEFGPTAILVDVLMSPPNGKTVFATTSASTLINVLPDVESFAKNGLAVMSQFVDVLASAKDRESAARSKDEYIRLALSNKELAAAMDRLGPPTKQQDAEFERLHGAELDAIAKRMQAEYDRLKQADYAGDAYFDEIEKAIQAAGK